MEIKHVGRGIYSAFDADGNRVGVAGPRSVVEAWVAGRAIEAAEEPAAVEATEEPAAEEPAKELDVRAYEASLSAVARRQLAELSDAVRDALAPIVKDAAIVDDMVRRMEPILRDPTNQTRRARRHRG